MSPAAATCHGVLLDVMGSGLLVTGPPGVGKSTLALELISRGHKLVADDLVEIRRDHDQLLGCRPAGGEGLLHLRALGLVPVAMVFGEQAIAGPEIRIALALLLATVPAATAHTRLDGHRDLWTIAGVELPRLWLDPAAGHSLATLAEVAVRLPRRTGSSLIHDSMHGSAGAQGCV